MLTSIWTKLELSDIWLAMSGQVRSRVCHHRWHPSHQKTLRDLSFYPIPPIHIYVHAFFTMWHYLSEILHHFLAGVILKETRWNSCTWIWVGVTLVLMEWCTCHIHWAHDTSQASWSQWEQVWLRRSQSIYVRTYIKNKWVDLSSPRNKTKTISIYSRYFVLWTSHSCSLF